MSPARASGAPVGVTSGWSGRRRPVTYVTPVGLPLNRPDVTVDAGALQEQ